MSGWTLGDARHNHTRSLKLIALRLTDAHRPIDVQLPHDSLRFFSAFKQVLGDGYGPKRKPKGIFRVFSLKKDAEDALRGGIRRNAFLLCGDEPASTAACTPSGNGGVL